MKWKMLRNIQFSVALGLILCVFLFLFTSCVPLLIKVKACQSNLKTACLEQHKILSNTSDTSRNLMVKSTDEEASNSPTDNNVTYLWLDSKPNHPNIVQNVSTKAQPFRNKYGRDICLDTCR